MPLDEFGACFFNELDNFGYFNFHNNILKMLPNEMNVSSHDENGQVTRSVKVSNIVWPKNPHIVKKEVNK